MEFPLAPLRRQTYRSTFGYTLGRRGITPLRNEHPDGLAIRRQEDFHHVFEALALENCWWQVESVIIF